MDRTPQTRRGGGDAREKRRGGARVHVSPAARVRGARVRARDRGEDATDDSGRRRTAGWRRRRWRPPPCSIRRLARPRAALREGFAVGRRRERSRRRRRARGEGRRRRGRGGGRGRNLCGGAANTRDASRVQTRPDQIGDVALLDFATAGSPRRTGSRTRGSPNARSRNSRLVARTRTRAGFGGDGDDFEGTKPASDADYFERLHLERAQRARLEAREKRTRCVDTTGADGATVLEPVGPTPAACAPPERSVPAPAVHGGAVPQLLQLVVQRAFGRFGRRDEGVRGILRRRRERRCATRGGPAGTERAPRGRTRRMSPTRASEEGEGIERRLGEQFDEYDAR